MADLAEIQALAAELNQARLTLAIGVQAYRVDKAALDARRMDGIREVAATVKARFDALREAVEASPGLFRSPRTLVLSGIKVGFAKRPGRLEVQDPDATVAAIERLLPDQATSLIKVSKAVVKSALGQIPAVTLKRIGVTVVDDADAAVVKPVDDQVERFVDALLKEEAA